MFRKLVSNLPFQPTLLSQVVLYLHQIRKEQNIRKIGLITASCVVLLQLFIVISPSRPSLTTTAADIVYGATSRQDIMQAYQNNRDQVGHKDIQKIFNHYGVNLDQITNARLTSISSNDSHSYFINSRSSTVLPNTFVAISGDKQDGVYEFPLSYWHGGSYPALTGIGTNGLRFWILLSGGGNIVYQKDTAIVMTPPSSPISISKDVANITQRIPHANNTTAKAGDVLQYTLTITNNSSTTVKDFALSGVYAESIGDIMEYAALTDKKDATYNALLQHLTWAPLTIPAHGSASKTFTVTIKKPLPTTPVSLSNPLSFDYVLHNNYGNDVVVNLHKPLTKRIEQTATKTPTATPPVNMVISGGVLLLIAYYYYRTKLLAAELAVIQHDFSTGGL